MSATPAAATASPDARLPHRNRAGLFDDIRTPDIISGLGGGYCDLALDLYPHLVLGNFQLVAGLQTHPECRRRSEVPRETQRSVAGDPALATDEIADAVCRDA